MTKTIGLARYLFSRLRQNGVDAVHGVPGDFTLKAMDQVKHAGLKWIAGCNELNSGYASDGYARVRGLSALMTTYGVGELCAVNAVAGSYAEHVPVVHIVGTAARAVQSKPMIHHSLGNGRQRTYAEIYEKITVAQANLMDAESAPSLIDNTIQQCLVQSQPVYIELPCDMVHVEVSAKELSEPLDAYPEIHGDQVRNVLPKLYNAKRPLLLVDSGRGMRHLRDQINDFVRITGIPTLTMPSGAGMVDHSIPNYFGVHSGPVGRIDTMPYVEEADLVLAFGPLFSDTQTLGWSTVPDPEKTITICKNSIEIEGTSYPINARKFMEQLLKVDPANISTTDTTSLGNFRTLKPQEADLDTSINQDGLWLRLNSYFKPGDVILLANGTPINGGRDFVLPSRAQIIASGLWLSSGHMLPAAQGVAAAHNARTILFEGDGSFQATAQELSTVIRYRLNLTIFIINNGGYAYVRYIHGMEEDYNDIQPWRYLEAASFFGAPDDYKVENNRVETWRDLESLLANESFQDGQGLKMVEVMVGKYDVPEKFKEVYKRAGERV